MNKPAHVGCCYQKQCLDSNFFMGDFQLKVI